MKKFTKILTSALLAASVFTTAVSADEQEKLLVIGDSITTGYGLEDYVQGDNYSAAGSFANQLAAAMELDGDSYVNSAIDGQTTTQLIDNIDAEAVANADKIVISIGGNDYLIPLIDAIVAAVGNNADLLASYGITVDATSSESALTALGMAAMLDGTGTVLKKVIEDVSSDETVASLTAIVETTVANMNTILADIYAANPDADVYLLNIYNPFNGAALFGDISALADTILAGIATGYDGLAAAYTTAGNSITIVNSQAAIGENAMGLTNIARLDIHPNADGHSVIFALLCDAMGVEVAEDAIADSDTDTNSDVDASDDADTTESTSADVTVPADKGNADTGIDGVTVFAGIALVAIGFAFAAKRGKK